MQTFQPETDTRAFRNALGQFVTGVTIITAPSVDGPMGITANSFSSVSLDPPLILWSVAKSSNRFKYFQAAPEFAVHVLKADQSDICHRFAQSVSTFDGLDMSLNGAGVPIINNCLARFECGLEASYDAGDHVIIIGRVQKVETQQGEPLVFSGGQYGRFINGL